MTTAIVNRGVAPNTKANSNTLAKTWRYFVCNDANGRTIELHQLDGNGGQLVQIVDGNHGSVKAADGKADEAYTNALAHAQKAFSNVTEWFR
jgi:hypothetical protein